MKPIQSCRSKSDILSYPELRSLITTPTTRRENAWHKKRYTSRTRGIMTTTPAWLVGSSLILPQSRTNVSSSSSYHHLAATASEGYYCKSGKKLSTSSIHTSGRVYCTSMASSQNIKPKPADDIQFHPTIFNADRQDETDVLIECKNVYKSFGAKHILRGVNLKIKHGEAVGIIGPSGTGKSTILKIISGLLAPDKGEVYIRGRRRHGLISDDDMSGLRIGLVFQSAALFDSLTVRENVGFLLYENSRMPDDQIQQLVAETLAAVGLKDVEDRMPSELSGGMKKRVALARSIIYDTTNNAIEPEVLLYDEPTAGLDPIASTVVEDLIRSVHCKGQDAVGKPGKIASYVVVTHQHSTIKRAVDRLVFLHEGKVVWEGMTDEFTSSTNPIVEQFASGNLDGPIQY